MKALILASGYGKRLAPLTLDHNKVMLNVGAEPVIDHIVRSCMMSGIDDIVIALSKNGSEVSDHLGSMRTYSLGDNLYMDVKFSYSLSDEPANTAGEIAKSKALLSGSDHFLLHYGDTLTNLSIRKMYEQHIKSGFEVTTPGMKEIKTESGIYKSDAGGIVSSFYEKPFIDDLLDTKGLYSNVPVYWISSKLLDNPDVKVGNDFNADVMPALIEDKKAGLYFQEGLWHLDVGDLKKYEQICRAYDTGRQAEIRKLA